MLFSPRESTTTYALPVRSATTRTPRASTPASSASARRNRPCSSSPTAARSLVRAPERAAATAWFNPFPPACTSEPRALTVSPGTGMASTRSTRSTFAAPSTTTDPVLIDAPGVRSPVRRRSTPSPADRAPEPAAASPPRATTRSPRCRRRRCPWPRREDVSSWRSPRRNPRNSSTIATIRPTVGALAERDLVVPVSGAVVFGSPVPQPHHAAVGVAEVLQASPRADHRVVAPVVGRERALLVAGEHPVAETHRHDRHVLDVDHRLSSVCASGGQLSRLARVPIIRSELSQPILDVAVDHEVAHRDHVTAPGLPPASGSRRCRARPSAAAARSSSPARRASP